VASPPSGSKNFPTPPISATAIVAVKTLLTEVAIQVTPARVVAEAKSVAWCNTVQVAEVYFTVLGFAVSIS
jgi:hypothetical protein